MVFYVGLRRGSYLDSMAENSVYVPAMKMDAGNGLPWHNAMPRTPAVAEDAVPGLRRRLPQAILIGAAKCGTGESLSRSRGMTRSVYLPAFRFSFFYIIIEIRKRVTKHPFPLF